MKATLTFDLPEEAEEHLRSVQSLDWALTVMDMDNYLRGRIKYEELSDEVDEALEDVRKKLWEIQEEHGVSIHNIS